MVDVPQLALLAHLLAAFAFVAGYAGTNVLTGLARRATSLDDRRAALRLAGAFDRRLNQRGGTAVIVTGPIVLLAFGYPFTAPWVVISTLLFLLVPSLGGLYGAPRARRIEAAVEAGDDATAAALLNAPRAVAVSRLENLAVVASSWS